MNIIEIQQRTRSWPRRTASAATALSALLASSSALANPKHLPFSYGYATQPQGAFEVEQYLDTVPVRIEQLESPGTQRTVTDFRYVLQTELEYGLSDRTEVGFYFVFKQDAGGSLGFDGVKQRLRLRLAEKDAWPIDVGLYLEVAELHDELEFEEKILLAKQLGALSLVANLGVEQEWAFQVDELAHVYNPTAGLTYELHPSVRLGAEYWMKGEFASDAPPPVHYAGPTLFLQGSRPWLALGVYGRLDTLSSGVPTGDDYGPLWVRAIFGVEL